MFKRITSYNQVIVALIISILTQAIAVKWFFEPSHLAMGGVSGIALGFEYLFKSIHIPITYGIMSFGFNIPLVILSWRSINKTFATFTLINILVAALLIDFFPKIILSKDIIVNAFSGSIIYGFGVITCLHAGISQGGTDVLGVYFSKRGKSSVGKIGLYVTMIAFAVTFYTSSFTLIIYSLIANLIITIIIDKYYENSAKLTLLIVSKKAERLNRFLQSRLKRGTTIWNSKGGYTSAENNVLMITISSDEKMLVYNIIKKLDPNCFVTTLTTESTIGEWTSRVGERKMSSAFFINDDEDVDSD